MKLRCLEFCIELEVGKMTSPGLHKEKWQGGNNVDRMTNEFALVLNHNIVSWKEVLKKVSSHIAFFEKCYWF